MENGEAVLVVLPTAHTGTRITKTAKHFATNSLIVEAGRKRAELGGGNVILSIRDQGWINRCVGMHTKTLSTSVLPDSVVLGISTVFGAFLVTGLSLTDAMDPDPCYTRCTFPLPLDLWEILAFVSVCTQLVLVCNRLSAPTVRLSSLD